MWLQRAFPSQQMSTNRNFTISRWIPLISLSFSCFSRCEAHIFCLFIFFKNRKCQFRSKVIGFYECSLQSCLVARITRCPTTCFPTIFLSSNINFNYLHVCNVNFPCTFDIWNIFEIAAMKTATSLRILFLKISVHLYL